MGELGLRRVSRAKHDLESYVTFGRNSGSFQANSKGGSDFISFTVDTPPVPSDTDGLFFHLISPSGFPTFVLPDVVYANAEKPERTLEIKRKSTYGFQVLFKNNSATNWSGNFEVYAISAKK